MPDQQFITLKNESIKIEYFYLQVFRSKIPAEIPLFSVNLLQIDFLFVVLYHCLINIILSTL